MEVLKLAKSLIAILLLSGFHSAVKGQADTVRNPEQFLFPEFSVGIAKMKNGEKIPLSLNYNIVTEKLVFMQKNQIYDAVNTSLIDTVYISGRKLIPAGKVFYEVITDGKADLFIQHKGTAKKPPRPAAYGGTSEVSSSTYISNLGLGNDRYRNQHKGEIVIEQGPLYWIRKDNVMNLVSGRSSLMKILADKKSEVRSYMSRSKLDPENPEHLNSLVRYYNTLP